MREWVRAAVRGASAPDGFVGRTPLLMLLGEGETLGVGVLFWALATGTPINNAATMSVVAVGTFIVYLPVQELSKTTTSAMRVRSGLDLPTMAPLGHPTTTAASFLSRLSDVRSTRQLERLAPQPVGFSDRADHREPSRWRKFCHLHFAAVSLILTQHCRWARHMTRQSPPFTPLPKRNLLFAS